VDLHYSFPFMRHLKEIYRKTNSGSDRVVRDSAIGVSFGYKKAAVPE